MVPAVPAVAGGVALALAFPGPDWSGAAWVALAPLLATAVQQRPRAALATGWAAGTVFFLLLLRWLDFTFQRFSAIPWPLTWGPLGLLAAYCGLYAGLVAAAVAWLARRRGAGRALLVAPALWVAGEWVRGWLMGGFPWGLLGYSQHRQLAVIQIAELGGVYAVSAVLVAANAALAGLAALERRPALAGAGLAALLVGATLGFGAWRLAAAPAPGEATVAIVQPSIDQPLKWDPGHAAETLRIHLRLTEEAGRRRPALVVWPETAVPTLLRRDPLLVRHLGTLASSLGTTLVVGSLDADGAPPTAVRNSVFLVDGAGLGARYDKIQLVPFGEYVPLAAAIGFVRGWAQFISELEPGTSAVVFPGPPAPFGVVICYEGIFPELVRRFVRGGARLMVNVTNDGWFGRTSGPLQHLAMAPLRAVEHRTAVVRAANTGVSAFIAPTGAVTVRLGLYERGTLVSGVPLRARETLYTRYGDWVAYAGVGLSGLALAAGAAGRRREC